MLKYFIIASRGQYRLQCLNGGTGIISCLAHWNYGADSWWRIITTRILILFLLHILIVSVADLIWNEMIRSNDSCDNYIQGIMSSIGLTSWLRKMWVNMEMHIKFFVLRAIFLFSVFVCGPMRLERFVLEKRDRFYFWQIWLLKNGFSAKKISKEISKFIWWDITSCTLDWIQIYLFKKFCIPVFFPEMIRPYRTSSS